VAKKETLLRNTKLPFIALETYRRCGKTCYLEGKCSKFLQKSSKFLPNSTATRSKLQ